MENVLHHIRKHKVEYGDAVMFDIDDTLIDAKTGRVIPHVKKLLDTCKRLGYIVTIITARPGDKESQDFTVRELKKHGITYDLLAFCMPHVKTEVKQDLMYNNGWYFVLSVGDQPTDLTDSDIYLMVK